MMVDFSLWSHNRTEGSGAVFLVLTCAIPARTQYNGIEQRGRRMNEVMRILNVIDWGDGRAAQQLFDFPAIDRFD